jgi:hypothetical protein
MEHMPEGTKARSIIARKLRMEQLYRQAEYDSKLMAAQRSRLHAPDDHIYSMYDRVIFYDQERKDRREGVIVGIEGSDIYRISYKGQVRRIKKRDMLPGKSYSELEDGDELPEDDDIPEIIPRGEPGPKRKKPIPIVPISDWEVERNTPNPPDIRDGLGHIFPDNDTELELPTAHTSKGVEKSLDNKNKTAPQKYVSLVAQRTRTSRNKNTFIPIPDRGQVVKVDLLSGGSIVGTVVQKHNSRGSKGAFTLSVQLDQGNSVHEVIYMDKISGWAVHEVNNQVVTDVDECLLSYIPPVKITSSRNKYVPTASMYVRNKQLGQDNLYNFQNSMNYCVFSVFTDTESDTNSTIVECILPAEDKLELAKTKSKLAALTKSVNSLENTTLEGLKEPLFQEFLLLPKFLDLVCTYMTTVGNTLFDLVGTYITVVGTTIFSYICCSIYLYDTCRKYYILYFCTVTLYHEQIINCNYAGEKINEESVCTKVIDHVGALDITTIVYNPGFIIVRDAEVEVIVIGAPLILHRIPYLNDQADASRPAITWLLVDGSTYQKGVHSTNFLEWGGGVG